MLQLALVPLQTSGEEFAIDPMVWIGVFVVLLLVAIGVGYWVYRDASKRDNNELLWAVGTAGLLFLFPLFGIIVLVAYVILRGDETRAEPTQDGTTSGDW